MNFDAFRQAVAAELDARGVSEYELYYRTEQGTSVSAFGSEIKEFSSAMGGGVCLRCICGGQMGYASTEELSGEQARELVSRAIDNASVLESDEPVYLACGGQQYQPLSSIPYPLPETDALVRTVLDTQRKLYASDARVVDGCETQGFSERMELAICNSKGLNLHYVNHIAGMVAASVVESGEEKTDSYAFRHGALDALDTDALVREATNSAVAKLGGEVAPTQVCPVVFAPKAMADLLATFSGVFSSERAQKGLSRLAGKEGEAIASAAVTLVDDPFYAESPMPMPFDAEGSPTCRKNIIEGGVLKTLLYNLKTAAIAGKSTTGNAAKGGYGSPIGISPFTFYLAPGTLSEDALVEKAQNGVYIDFLGGLHAGANAVTGDFSLQSAGFLIENGKKTKPVKSFTVAGNFYELLGKITDVSDRVQLPFATGMTAFGAPAVLVESLSIAGK